MNVWQSLNLLQKFRMNLKYHKTIDKDIGKIISWIISRLFFFSLMELKTIKYILDAFSSNIVIVN